MRVFPVTALLGAVLFFTGCGFNKSDPYQLKIQAAKEFSQSDYRQAVKTLTMCLSRVEKNRSPEKLSNGYFCARELGRAHVALNQPNEAILAYRAALNYKQLITLRYGKHRFREFGPESLVELATVYRKQGKSFEAAEFYQQALRSVSKEEPTHLIVYRDAWSGLGLAYEKLGLTQDAKIAFSNAQKIGGNSNAASTLIKRKERLTNE